MSISMYSDNFLVAQTLLQFVYELVGILIQMIFCNFSPLMFRLLATDRRSRSRRKGQGMTRISWPSCPFAVRFGHRFGFSDHLKARGPRPRRPFPPAWRFSARFGHTRRCAKLLQNRWHDTTYLSRGDDVTTPFPRPVQGEP